MEKEVRLIDANEIVKVAEHAYREWCLAMVGADDTRKVNEVFQKQYLCKVVKAVAENCSTIDPESLRPKGRWKLNKDGSGTCSECHRTRNDVWDMDNWDNFCSHCGADMREEK